MERWTMMYCNVTVLCHTVSLGTIGAYAFQNSRLISEGYALGLGDQMVIRAAIRVLRGESFLCYCKPQRRATWPRPKQPLFWP